MKKRVLWVWVGAVFAFFCGSFGTKFGLLKKEAQAQAWKKGSKALVLGNNSKAAAKTKTA